MKHLLPIALLAVLALAPGAVAGTAKSCGSVAFTPNSDDLASKITAGGVSCKVARGFVRAAKGRPGARFRGYTCTKKSLDTALPSKRYSCTSGAKVIRWIKT